MTVYVDDMAMPAQVGGLNAKWSHLIADSREELHEFAERLGLKRAWFQDPAVSSKMGPAKPGTYAAEAWHYDVVASKRKLAVAMGAIPVSLFDLPDLIHHRMEHGTCR